MVSANRPYVLIFEREENRGTQRKTLQAQEILTTRTPLA